MIRSFQLVPKSLGIRSKCLTAKDEWNSVVSKLHSNTQTSKNYVVKDNIVTKGSFTTAGSNMLREYTSPFDATVVELLRQHAWTVSGKANLDEFGMGSSNTNTIFGPSINPLFNNDEHITGGSSGGSAAAVAGGLCEFALGTDTGGSVRLPASNCGIYGFKPSYGRFSRWGVIAYAQTLDTVGILSKHIETVRSVYNILNEYDDKDPTSILTQTRNSIQKAVDNRNKERNGKFVIGVPQEFLVQELTDDSREKLEYTINRLILLGHSVVPVSIPSIKRLLQSYYTIATAEAASNLARYDGVVYGSNDTTLSGADNIIKGNRSKFFGPEVQRRIVLGNYTMSSASGDHYAKATELREQLVNEFNQVLFLPNCLLSDDMLMNNSECCDFLISPTTVNKPLTIKDFLENEKRNLLESYTNDILTAPTSLAGLPAISLPVLDNQSGVSTQGVQLFGQYGDDEALIGLSSDLMKHVM